MKKEDCLFCGIVAGDVPSTKIYEDDVAYAFEDVNPKMPVHILVVPKNHYDSIQDNIPNEELGHLFNVAVEIAREKGLSERGFRIVVNTGDDACQTVHHLHIHVVGGEKMNDGNPSLSALNSQS